MAQELTLSVSWNTILITIAAAFLSLSIAAILKPSIFILRDVIAWSLINRFIYNNNTKEDVENLARYKKRLETQFKEYGDYLDDDGHLVGGWLDGEKTDSQYVDIHNATKNLLEEKTRELEVDIERKKERMNFIIQHLGMENTKNPIEQLSISLKSHYEINPPEEVKVDFDWDTKEAIKVIKNDI